ncbi:MAG TPA: hypothetical protein VN445_14290 [Rectinemataceae bacterium]|nr:hypothetical protein [Rectinemataceae bacterium]
MKIDDCSDPMSLTQEPARAGTSSPRVGRIGGPVMTCKSPWKELYEKRIYFAVRRSPAILFGRSTDEVSSIELLASRGISVERAAGLAARVDPAWFPDGALLDIEFLDELAAGADEGGASAGEPVAKAGKSASESFRAIAGFCRTRLQGTDGLRGKTKNIELSYRKALALFLLDGTVTPAFLGLSAKALGMECLANGLIGEGQNVVVGADGRDTSGAFAGAVLAAFAELGFRVLDAGIIATPGIPLFARRAKCRIGAIVTASHNPANQNGIKFIHDGFKLADDGPAGEAGLTAYMYRIADYEAPSGSSAGQGEIEDVSAEATEFLYRVDMENARLEPKLLAGLRIVYDGANGAYSDVATRVLADLGADFRAVNVDPKGYNINQDGGVGEIEGHAFFEDSPAPGEGKGDGESGLGLKQEPHSSDLPTIRAMFDEGRAAAETGRVFGIVNDGDGDRGYLLAYMPGEDRVYVVPGDEVAFWLARGRRDEGSLGREPVCVNSVESDILAGHYVEKLLGARSEIACVGDKHLLEAAKAGRNHIVGCEESGHVTFGVPVTDKEGNSCAVYTGNGLLSILRAICVIQESGAGLDEIIHPFPPGVKDFRCVYFVDKSRFYRGSKVWREDEMLAMEILLKRKPEGYSVRRVDFPEDPQMLYLACFNPESLMMGALFVRNSGTELKSCSTLRCSRSLYPMMREALLLVHERNRELMKDRSSRDAVVEECVLYCLGSATMSRDSLKEKVEKRLGDPIAEPDFAAILYAMRKEALLAESADGITRIG